MNLLNAGCGTHYAKGWINTDVWSDGKTTRPDVVVKPGKPYPFDDNYFDAIFLGHVLEHISWRDVPEFLNDMKRIAKPNAEFLICGPDVFKTIKRWSEGYEPWDMVLSALEHQDIEKTSSNNPDWWDGAAHHWNCHHERVWQLLAAHEFTNLTDVADLIPKDTFLKQWKNKTITWPVVGHWYWHFAILCTNKK